MNHLQNHKGITLLEIMIVMVIITILTSMAVPSYNQFMAHLRLNASARSLLADIRGARVSAIKEGWQYGILYNNASQYQIVRAVKPTFAQAPGFTVTATSNFTSSNTGYYGITMTVPVNMPVFQRSGTVSSWNSGTNTFTIAPPDPVVLTSNYGEIKTVSINTAGFSQIQ